MAKIAGYIIKYQQPIRHEVFYYGRNMEPQTRLSDFEFFASEIEATEKANEVTWIDGFIEILPVRLVKYYTLL